MQEIEFSSDSQNYVFYINELIYPRYVIMKAAYMYIERYYIYFDYEKEDVIKVVFTPKENTSSDIVKGEIGEFHNELLHQVLRLEIFNKTKNIRELILGRALYSTCIEVADDIGEDLNCNIDDAKNEGYTPEYDFAANLEESYDADPQNIAVSWFDNNIDGEKNE
jgi:His-Xaa-Ser system protein HxsD